MRRKLQVLAACIILAAITGCSTEPRPVSIHDPGVYKGAKDPVLALQQQQKLVDRCKLVQTDR